MIDAESVAYWLYCKDCVAIVGVTSRRGNVRIVLRPNRCAHPVNELLVMENREVIPLRKESASGIVKA